MSAAESGYLLLADISGYTAYLSDSELEHARDTLAQLLGVLIDHTKPPLVLSKLEGDAVFSYTWGDEPFASAQTFVELIENTYIAFRRAIELMVMNNTCQCSACANVSMLDLKFFVHHGTFVHQDLGVQTELVGTDVNLVHRLMKNSVSARTGVAAYTLWTDAAIRRLGIEEHTATMTSHVETYDDLGDVPLWVRDMHPIWEDRRDERRVEFDPLITVAHEIALPPEAVWGYLTQPEFRAVIVGGDRVALTDRKGGRIASESQYQCFHGNQMLRQVIVEWAPFERLVSQDTDTMALMRKLTWKNENRLEETEGGTRLSISLGSFEGPRLRRSLATAMLKTQSRVVAGSLRDFAALVEADWAERRTADDALPGPAVTPEAIRDAAAGSLGDR